mmetsp:Transcript_36033/g.58290  ORF Transcript_36033/g.58290 Transcript_36033/m.58290 type:complete len:89 (+) Transcript_36033:530-796(+)
MIIIGQSSRCHEDSKKKKKDATLDRVAAAMKKLEALQNPLEESDGVTSAQFPSSLDASFGQEDRMAIEGSQNARNPRDMYSQEACSIQ